MLRRQGPATPVPIPLALGARQRPLSLTHTVDALLTALVEQVVEASGPPDAHSTCPSGDNGQPGSATPWLTHTAILGRYFERARTSQRTAS